jgi:hypothetical protein
MANEEDLTKAELVGIARNLIRLATELVQQGALDREKTISAFRDFAAAHEGLLPQDQMTRMWSDYLIQTLEDDPSRPPPAAVVDLFQKK